MKKCENKVQVSIKTLRNMTLTSKKIQIFISFCTDLLAQLNAFNVLTVQTFCSSSVFNPSQHQSALVMNNVGTPRQVLQPSL